jgi:hypothetical protein
MSEHLKDLLELYENIETGLKPYKQFYEQHKDQLKEWGYTSLKKVKETLRSESLTGQLNRIPMKVKRSRIKAATPFQQMHMDFMTLKAKTSNLKDANILVLVDVYSRYIWAEKFPTKTARNVKIFLQNKIPEMYGSIDITTDAAPEFKKAISDFPNIEHTTSTSLFHASIAEAAIKKIRLLWREVQTINPSKKFSKKMLDDIISNLNERKIFNNNRTSPFDILFNRHYLLEDTLAIKSDDIKNEPVEKAFYVGDFVRIKNDVNKSITYKKKSSVNNFKNEIYRIYKKYFNKDQQLFTYKVASIFGDFVFQRPFYYEEMIPVSSRILKNTYVDDYSYKPLNQTEKNFLGYLEVDQLEN